MFQYYINLSGRTIVNLGMPFLHILHMVQTSTVGKEDHVAVR